MHPASLGAATRSYLSAPEAVAHSSAGKRKRARKRSAGRKWAPLQRKGRRFSMTSVTVLALGGFVCLRRRRFGVLIQLQHAWPAKVLARHLSRQAGLSLVGGQIVALGHHTCAELSRSAVYILKRMATAILASSCDDMSRTLARLPPDL